LSQERKLIEVERTSLTEERKESEKKKNELVGVIVDLQNQKKKFEEQLLGILYLFIVLANL